MNKRKSLRKKRNLTENLSNWPSSSSQQDTNEIGKSDWGGLIARLGWRNTPRTGDEDFGFDGTVAIFRNRSYFGLDFTYQLKSTSRLTRNLDGTISCSGIKKSTARLFKEANSTPLIIVADTTAKSIYWDFAATAITRWENQKNNRSKNTKTITLRIAPNQFDAPGIQLLTETLSRINAGSLRPITVIESPPRVILAKLDSAADADSIRSELQDIVDNTNSGNYLRAIEHGIALLPKTSNDSDRVRVLKVLSRCFFERGLDEEAINYASQGFSLHDPSLCANLISLLAKVRRFDEASQRLSTLPPAIRNSASILSSEGLLALLSGNTDSALHHYQQAIAQDNRADEARMNAAFILRDAGRLTEGKNLLRNILDSNPRNSIVSAAYANILLMEYKLRPADTLLVEAERHYRDLIAYFRLKNPSSKVDKDAQGMALAGQAVIALWRGNILETEKLLNEAIEAGLTWPTLFYNLGNCDLAANRPAAARRNLVKAMRMPPDEGGTHQTTHVDIWRKLGKTYLDLFVETKHPKFSRKSIYAYQKALALENDPNSHTFVNLGIIYLATDRLGDARQLANQYADKQGSHYLLALCFHKEDNRAQMLAELNEELRMDPDGFEINMLMGEYWFTESRARQALPYFQKAASVSGWFLNVTAPRLVHLLLRCYRSLKGIKFAQEFLKTVPEFLVLHAEAAKGLT